VTDGGQPRDRETVLARRREADLLARRRRLLGIDMALAVLAAVLVLALGPGLAIAGLAAAIVLLLGAASYGLRRRRGARARRPVDQPPQGLPR
jgi:hypothetical protein